ncbi:MAG: MBL fold metallo-hydrolase [Planctomycetes bacterium]|nr:MBL fold metallo-hydrolase [Planctomycetota bacterium]
MSHRDAPRAVLALGLGALFAALPAQEPEKKGISTTHLAGSVHMMSSGFGGNLAACAGDDGVLLVDAEYARLAAQVGAAVDSLGAGPVEYLVNTHWHPDHVGGNETLARAGAMIVAQDNVRRSMSSGQRLGVLEMEVPASPAAALPVVTFSESVTLHLNGEEVCVQHIAGAHTDGDSIVRFRRANVIHAGDIVFQGGYPFIDVTNGGSIDGMIAAVEAIAALCDDETRIIPGHGSVMDRAELLDYGAMLRAFREAIAAEMAAGRDLAAIQERRPTAALDERWGTLRFSPERFTELVYRSLAGR